VATFDDESRIAARFSHNPGMANHVPGAFRVLRSWRWWIALAGCAIALSLIVFEGHTVVWVLAWLLPIFFAAIIWGPILTAWGRGGRRAGEAFREGLDGK
jgi:hypothetical protein